MRSVETAECGNCGVWKLRSVETAECGNCGVWKLRSVGNAAEQFNFPFQFQAENITTSISFGKTVWKTNVSKLSKTRCTIAF